MLQASASVGSLAPAISRLVNALTTEIAREDTNLIDRYLQVLITHPVAGLGFEVKVLWGLTKLGEYQHSKQRQQKWMRRNFERMRGSLTWSVAEMMLATAIGWSFAELATRQEGTEFVLDTLQVVDPRYYDFAGTIGGIQALHYWHPTQGKVVIPYEKGVHTINQPYLALGRDPYGIAQMRRVVAAWEAWKILIAEMVIAGKRQATPIVVAKGASQEYIVITDQYGNPQVDPTTGQELRIPMLDHLTTQVEELDNRSVIVTDIRNEIASLQQMSGATAGNFFFEGLRYLERIMLMGEAVPETVVSTGISGTGDSELNTGHMALMDLTIGATMFQIQEGLLENVCRPLLEWRFGRQDDYGAFVVPAEKQEDAVALLGAIEKIVDGPLISNQDLEVVNRARELAGVPPTDQVIQRLQQPPQPTPEPTADEGDDDPTAE